MKTLRRRKKKSGGRGGMWTTWVGWDVVEDVLLFGVCCLGSWVLVYLNLGRVLLGLAVLHVVGGVEEEDRAW